MRAEEISWRLDPAFHFTSSSPPSRVVVIHYKASGIQLDRISAENKTVREINWSGDK
jgi:hypothetical protein